VVEVVPEQLAQEQALLAQAQAQARVEAQERLPLTLPLAVQAGSSHCHQE
jgi:hypothetical protein